MKIRATKAYIDGLKAALEILDNQAGKDHCHFALTQDHQLWLALNCRRSITDIRDLIRGCISELEAP